MSRQDEHLAQVPCPVLVLHAEDDPKIPVSLARALVQEVRGAGKGDISIEVAPASLGYAHNQVCFTFSCIYQAYISIYFLNVQVFRLESFSRDIYNYCHKNFKRTTVIPEIH